MEMYSNALQNFLHQMYPSTYRSVMVGYIQPGKGYMIHCSKDFTKLVKLQDEDLGQHWLMLQ